MLHRRRYSLIRIPPHLPVSFIYSHAEFMPEINSRNHLISFAMQLLYSSIHLIAIIIIIIIICTIWLFTLSHSNLIAISIVYNCLINKQYQFCGNSICENRVQLGIFFVFLALGAEIRFDCFVSIDYFFFYSSSFFSDIHMIHV